MLRLTKYKSLFLFLFLFYLSMGVSKYTQVLWFDKTDNILNYSFSYSAMAIAGAFSFIISSKISHLSLKKTISIFIPIYSIGMLLRIFPSSTLLAIISGGISGIGASILLLVIRTWIYELTEKSPDDKAGLASSRYTIMQISLTIATILAGQIIYFFNGKNIYVIVLILSSILLLVLLILKNIPDNEVKNDKKNNFVFPKDKRKAIYLYIVVIILGISSSIMEPILPVIVKDIGFNTGIVSIIISAYGIFKITSVFVFQQKNISKNPQISFFILQFIVGIIFILSAIFSVNRLSLLLVLLVLSAGTAGFFVLKEMMEYDFLPKKELGIYLGLLQSSFLIGDALGSPIGSLVYEYKGRDLLFVFFGIVTIVSGILYTGLYYKMKKTYENS